MFSNWNRLWLCGLVWTALSLLCFMFPDSRIVLCGAEAHSHQMENATSRATVCLMWTGIDKTHTFCFFRCFDFYHKPFSCHILDQIVKADWLEMICLSFTWMNSYNNVSVLSTSSELCLYQPPWLHDWCVSSLSPRPRLLWHRLHWDSLRTSSQVFYFFKIVLDMLFFLCYYQRFFWWIYLRRP